MIRWNKVPEWVPFAIFAVAVLLVILGGVL